ncbi:hypothetical protein [Halosimplex marinum]|uniref:hypothetical protein n=1 Tax=Halosimplex marinum TaxID=3396620 RepID=UPI003F553EA6
MTDKTQVNIRVLEETKSRWDDALESPEYDSLTHLITLSVEKELNSDESNQNSSLDAGATAEAVRDEVVPALEQIRRGIDSLDGRIDRLENEVNSQGPEYDMEKAVIDVLPTPPDGVEKHDQMEKWAMTAEEVHGALDSRGIIIDKPDIRNTLSGLADTTGFVKEREGRDDDPSAPDSVFWRVE